MDLTDLYVVKAGGVFAAIMLIAVSRLRAHHPFARFGPANQITTLRALIVSVVAGLIGEPPLPIIATSAAGAALMATLLDGVDGWVARRTRMVSDFGARFDLEVDALLIQTLAILAWRWDKAGPWVLASGLLRYAFVAAGWVWPWMRRRLLATVRGRVICIVQIGALILALLPMVTRAVSARLAAVGLLALFYSFLVDTVWLWQRRGLN